MRVSQFHPALGRKWGGMLDSAESGHGPWGGRRGEVWRIEA
jgi:hypothetical protein